MEITRTEEWDAIMSKLYSNLESHRTAVVVKARTGNLAEISKAVGAHDAVQEIITLLEEQ